MHFGPDHMQVDTAYYAVVAIEICLNYNWLLIKVHELKKIQAYPKLTINFCLPFSIHLQMIWAFIYTIQ